uniref:Uncharacterized protein n=1 Tax=Romanomermis culicivorax TaxID=13658 RepID=A0A915J7U7_ROMCU
MKRIKTEKHAGITQLTLPDYHCAKLLFSSQTDKSSIPSFYVIWLDILSFLGQGACPEASRPTASDDKSSRKRGEKIIK